MGLPGGAFLLSLLSPRALTAPQAVLAASDSAHSCLVPHSCGRKWHLRAE